MSVPRLENRVRHAPPRRATTLAGRRDTRPPAAGERIRVARATWISGFYNVARSALLGGRRSGRAETFLAGRSFGRNFMMMWAIATCVQNDYSLNMRLCALRRWFALCAVVALSMGLVAQGFAAAAMDAKMMTAAAAGDMSPEIGRASCRERVCQYV